MLRKEMKEVLGERREYLTIKILHNDMTVMVPTENAALAGFRRVIDEETLKKVLAVLQRRVLRDAEELEPPLQAQPGQDQDRRHLRARRGRAQPRDPRAEKGLSTGEKQMFTRAKRILVSELMYALAMDEGEVEAHLCACSASKPTGNGAGTLAAPPSSDCRWRSR